MGKFKEDMRQNTSVTFMNYTKIRHVSLVLLEMRQFTVALNHKNLKVETMFLGCLR